MITTIDYDKVKFYQSEENRKTVAIYEGCELDAYMDVISEEIKIYDISSINPIEVSDEFLLPHVIKAASTCHSSDNWDPELGKKQAFFKLLRSYNKMKSRVISRLINNLRKEENLLLDIEDKYSDNIEHYTKLVRYPKDNKR